MPHKGGLQLGWGHLKPFVFDQFFKPINNEHIAVLIDDCHVSRFQPAIGSEGVFGGLLIVQIANHHLRTFDPKLAFLSWRHVLATVGVHDAAECIGHCQARCARAG